MAIEKAQDRLEILKKIEEYEKKGWFSKDVEDDPETIPLYPDQIDYINKKLSSKLWMKFANILARNNIELLLKKKALIIKEVTGIENFIKMKDVGAILTCNHFNAFDNFAVFKAVDKYVYHKELVKVCREGNYTNFPGFYGFLFRHCNTLPLSSQPSTMKKFMEAVQYYLKQGRPILIYPEQAMWWNYRKPRPLTSGAFKIAAEFNVPIIPAFITLSDSDRIGPDGFPIQEYSIHYLEPIYPKADLSVRKNAEYMKEKNYEAWKAVYEKVYGIPLVYSCGEVNASGVVSPSV